MTCQNVSILPRQWQPQTVRGWVPTSSASLFPLLSLLPRKRTHNEQPLCRRRLLFWKSSLVPIKPAFWVVLWLSFILFYFLIDSQEKTVVLRSHLLPAISYLSHLPGSLNTSSIVNVLSRSFQKNWLGFSERSSRYTSKQIDGVYSLCRWVGLILLQISSPWKDTVSLIVSFPADLPSCPSSGLRSWTWLGCVDLIQEHRPWANGAGSVMYWVFVRHNARQIILLKFHDNPKRI